MPSARPFPYRRFRAGRPVIATPEKVPKAKSYKDGKTLNVGGWVQQFSDFAVLPIRTNWPTTARRLPNGHTLVGSQSTNQVVELDRKGKVVWQHANTDGQVYIARRR